MNTLIAGFIGKNNTSKAILDNLKNCQKLYLENDKLKSNKQIDEMLEKHSFNKIIILGQKPLLKDKISIEIQAKQNDESLYTNFEVDCLTKQLKIANIDYKISFSPGTSFCNNVYYHTLKYLSQKKRDDKCVFLHVPQIKNFNNKKEFLDIFNSFLID